MIYIPITNHKSICIFLLQLYRLKNNMKLPKWLQKPPFTTSGKSSTMKATPAVLTEPDHSSSFQNRPLSEPYTSKRIPSYEDKANKPIPSLFDIVIDTKEIDVTLTKSDSTDKGKQKQKEYGKKEQAYGEKEQTHGEKQPAYSDKQQRYGEKQAYREKPQAHLEKQQPHREIRQTYDDKQQGYSNEKQGYSNEKQGYGDEKQGYGNEKQGYGDKWKAYGDDHGDGSSWDKPQRDGHGGQTETRQNKRSGNTSEGDYYRERRNESDYEANPRENLNETRQYQSHERDVDAGTDHANRDKTYGMDADYSSGYQTRDQTKTLDSRQSQGDRFSHVQSTGDRGRGSRQEKGSNNRPTYVAQPNQSESDNWHSRILQSSYQGSHSGSSDLTVSYASHSSSNVNRGYWSSEASGYVGTTGANDASAGSFGATAAVGATGAVRATVGNAPMGSNTPHESYSEGYYGMTTDSTVVIDMDTGD